ncbi:TPA: NUDIX hydrolase [Legionella pneumophila]|nr:NUDIX hydrolase [Legionella pneumophila]HAT9986932.1 hypothetical protein [Legionella pneumophila subsp. pneumophila]HBP6862217.1 NUDIX hydrolase [Legionella pneumophila]
MLTKLEKKIVFILLSNLDKDDLFKLSLVSKDYEKLVLDYINYQWLIGLIKQYIEIDPKELVNILVEHLHDRKFIDSLIIRLLDTYPATKTPGLTYHGLTLVDNLTPIALTGQHRSSVMVYPFPAPKVAALMLYFAKVKEEEYIVLVESKRRTDSAIKGLSIPGGNLNVIAPQGAEHGVTRLDDKIRDEAEERIMKGNVRGYQSLQKQQGPLPLKKEKYHQSLKDCAQTEGFEETGIQHPDSLIDQSIFVCQKEYLSRSRRMHLILHYYVTHCGEYNGENELPALHPMDDFEIESAQWIKVSDINRSAHDEDFSGVSYQLHYHEKPIARPHLDGLNQILRFMRDKDIQQSSDGRFSNLEALRQAEKSGEFDNLSRFLKTQDCEFTPESTANHHELCQALKKSLISKQNTSDSIIKQGLTGFGLFALGAGAVLLAQYLAPRTIQVNGPS